MTTIMFILSSILTVLALVILLSLKKVKIVTPISIILFLFIPCLTFSQNKTAYIRIVQEQGIFLSEFETHLLMRKEPFKIQVLLENVRGVYVFASIRDSIYRFSQSDSIYDFIYLPILELKEDPYNTFKDLNVSTAGWSYWYYDANQPHPFSQQVIKLDGDRIVCTKFINQIYDITEGKQICMDDIDGPLYLFFIAVSEYDKNGKPSKELLRRKVKISWSNGLE